MHHLFLFCIFHSYFCNIFKKVEKIMENTKFLELLKNPTIFSEFLNNTTFWNLNTTPKFKIESINNCSQYFPATKLLRQGIIATLSFENLHEFYIFYVCIEIYEDFTFTIVNNPNINMLFDLQKMIDFLKKLNEN